MIKVLLYVIKVSSVLVLVWGLVLGGKFLGSR